MNCERMNKKLSISFCIICTLFPVFFLYSTSIAGLTIADVILLVWMLFGTYDIIIKRYYYVKRFQVSFILLTIDVFFVFLMVVFNGYSLADSLKTGRYLVYLLATSVFGIRYINKNYFEKSYIVITVVASIYLILQALSWGFFRFKLPGYLPFLKITNSNSYQLVQFYATRISVYRPCSVFAEPAHFASYVIGALALLIYRERYLTALVVTLAIALSSSGTGIISAIIIWFIWLCLRQYYSLRLKHVVIIITILVASIVLISTNPQVQLFIKRTIITDSSILGRFGGYSKFADLFRQGKYFDRMFGHGITDVDIYLTGVLQFIYSFGYIGTCLLVIGIIRILLFGEKSSMIMIACLIVLSIGTQALVSYMIIIYIGYSIVLEEENQYECERDH